MKVTIAGEAASTPEAHAHMDAHTRQMYDQMPEIVAGERLFVCLMLTPTADYEAAMGGICGQQPLFCSGRDCLPHRRAGADGIGI